MKIPLSNGLFVEIDDDDWKKVSRYRWVASKAWHNNWYARVCVDSDHTKSGKTTILMHRLILDFPRGFVDHRDGNGLNNRRANLRQANPRQNAHNQRKGIRGLSQYKGVSWDSRCRRWMASIRVNGRTEFLGRFLCEAGAARAYDEAAYRNFGEFARLNFEGLKWV